MLTHLVIHRFAVLEHLELSFKPGMSVFTGETGAGKSILLDALGLTLGERAESSFIRPPHTSAEVSAIYDISDLPLVQKFLQTAGLANGHLEQHDQECIIRRVLTEEGRSRAYINGHAVPLQQIRELSEYLITVHSQHQHHALLKPSYQTSLLDAYANHADLLTKVRQAYQALHALEKEYQQLVSLQTQTEKLVLLEYQVQELNELKLGEKELQDLEQEHKQLSHAQSWAQECEDILNTISLENDSKASRGIHGSHESDVLSAMHHAITRLKALCLETPTLKNCYELFNNALIALDEGVNELRSFKDNITSDPARLSWCDERLGLIFALARKHRVNADQLLEHQDKLTKEAESLKHLESQLKALEDKKNLLKKEYQIIAKSLSDSRQKASISLSQQILERLHQLEMPHAQFEIRLRHTETCSELGSDEIEFLVSLNPGHPLQPLRKIASGGELSRISLAIQVITAEKMTIPSLIFDEVDVGVSGKTAEIVGKLLRTLGKQAQVFSVTHLPQVAAQGHHHYKVEKKQTDDTTTTFVSALDAKGKIMEIARLLGGIHITENTVKHAQEMLETV